MRRQAPRQVPNAGTGCSSSLGGVRDSTYAPGWSYYLAVTLCLAVVGVGLASFTGSWGVATMPLIWIGIVGLLGAGTLLAIWRRFTVRENGLYVQDFGGARLHRWEDLGRPIAAEMDPPMHRKRRWPWRMPRRRFFGDAYVHVIRSASGRQLYRVLPWYPQRRELIRLVSRRAREAAQD